MRTTQEKIVLYVGTKCTEYITNELSNKVVVVVSPPAYSSAILTWQQEWAVHVQKKQSTILSAIQMRLIKLEAERNQKPDIYFTVKIAKL